MPEQRNDVSLLKAVVQALPKVSVTVLADLVADEFVFGEIARVSREAPVLILKHRERTVVPGGGGNAVMNLASLGVSVFPVGVVGDDEAGELLLEAFRKTKVPTSGITRMKGHITTTKTRILAAMSHNNRQQVVRVDREPGIIADNDAVMPKLLKAALKSANESSALLVSDYGYGAATPKLLAKIKGKNWPNRKPITLDSRYRMLEFSGAAAATPNEPEVEEALGTKIGANDTRLLEAGKTIMRRMKLDSLVITRGRDGMVAFERGKTPLVMPVFGSDEAIDVTGAGDTVIAAFTAALAAGADTATAAQLANLAGGVVVMKRGTATVSAAELLTAIDEFAAAKTL